MASSSGSESIPPPSQFQTIFDAALREYAKKTGNELATHPLATTLEVCDSTDKVLDVLQNQAHEFHRFRDGDWKMRLMRRLKPTVDILLALSNSGVLGGSIGLVRRMSLFPVCFNAYFEEISTCSSDICWHWSPTCGVYLNFSFRLLALVTRGSIRRPRELAQATTHSSISSNVLKVTFIALRFSPGFSPRFPRLWKRYWPR
jgi:hypothetical protein